jgi:hypothetical protein
MRWKLETLLASCKWLRLNTLGGLSRLLTRLGIAYKRGRAHIHSPDVLYEEKVQLVTWCLSRARDDPDHVCALYQDEFSYYRQPTLAQAYEARGRAQPLAHRSYSRDTPFRVAAALDVVTGQVTWMQRSKFDRRNLVRFYQAICEQYPHAETIYLIQDNWPVHFHPDVLAALGPQIYPWPWLVPDNWPREPGPKAMHLNLPIKLICLPTYASWLNPIEKLWRWLKQDVLHLHDSSADWPALRDRVAAFLDRFLSGSKPLLRYTGLLPD